ncbi:MAG: hypothetical protein R6W91_08100 [Thermoplasmata archaeon]
MKIMAVAVVVVLMLTALNGLIFAAILNNDSDNGDATRAYVEISGDTMTGDLELQSLIANGIITGNGSGLSSVDAAMLGGNGATYFAVSEHDHAALYYSKAESDSMFATASHSHAPGDATTLDGYDSSDFVMGSHTHDDRYWNKTEMANRHYDQATSDGRFATLAHTHAPGDADTLDGYDSADFAMAIHTHDDRYWNKTAMALLYYNRTESDATFAAIGHTHAAGDATTLDGYDSLDFAMAPHTHDDRYWNKTEMALLYYNRTESDDRYALALHHHDDRYYTQDYINNTYYNQTESEALFALYNHTHDDSLGWEVIIIDSFDSYREYDLESYRTSGNYSEIKICIYKSGNLDRYVTLDLTSGTKYQDGFMVASGVVTDVDPTIMGDASYQSYAEYSFHLRAYAYFASCEETRMTSVRYGTVYWQPVTSGLIVKLTPQGSSSAAFNIIVLGLRTA